MVYSNSEGRSFWPFFSAAIVVVLVAAAIRWSLVHPYGIHWDETEYLNNAGLDLHRLLGGHILRLGGRLFIASAGRPPAYRLIALPFLTLFGFHTTVARLASLTCFVFTLLFIYLATRRIGGQVAGAIAVLIFALSPEVLSASIFFGTDTSLYLATAAMLYYLFAFWTDSSENAANWVGLGLAVGLGFLSKASFAPIAFPVLVFALFVRHYKYFGIPSVASELKAAGLASFIAGPWWILNVRSAIGYSKYARDFVRNSLGPPSLITWIRWFDTVLECLLGHAVSILIGLILIACFRKAIIKKETILDSLQKTALGACACAGLPIVIAQLSGTNHLLRHISPAMIPIAIAVGVLSVQTGWIASKAFAGLAAFLFCVQLLMIVFPLFVPNKHAEDLKFVNGAPAWQVMIRFDQWNWGPLRDISYGCAVGMPKISFLGSGREFDPVQIEYPWVLSDLSSRQAKVVLPDVKWLWRYEDGPIDWHRVMDAAGDTDLVVTAPHYVGEVENKEDLDNQYNAEFADRFSSDSRFRGPIRLEMGRFEPIEVDVFLKKTLVCSSGQGAPVN